MFSTVFVAAQTVSCDDARVKYAQYKPAESQFQVEKLKRGPVPDEKELKKTPQFTRWLSQSQPDYMKTGPWTTTILVGDTDGALLKLVFPNHGSAGVHSQWLNEKELFLQFWPGRFESVDLIFDVEKGSLIYSETANYGELEFCK